MVLRNAIFSEKSFPYQKSCNPISTALLHTFLAVILVLFAATLGIPAEAQPNRIAQRPQWQPRFFRHATGPQFLPYSDEARCLRAREWFQEKCGPDLLIPQKPRPCGWHIPGSSKEAEKWVEAYLDNCYSKGPWSERQKAILQAARKIINKRCGWYIASKLHRRAIDSEFIPDYGGAECHSVKIRIRLDQVWRAEYQFGGGHKIVFGTLSESKGVLAYAKDFQDFYINNNRQLSSDTTDLLYASGWVKYCNMWFIYTKCKTVKLSKGDFHMGGPGDTPINVPGTGFGFWVQYPPEVGHPNIKYFGPVIRANHVVQQLPNLISDFHAITPTDIQQLVADGAITFHRSIRDGNDSLKVVLEIELLGGGEGGLARVGDAVEGGGKIIEGAATVFVNGKPAARRGDKVSGGERGEETIITGTETVFIEGKIAAQALDVTDSGGYIGEGSQNTIGGDGHRNKEEEDLQEHASKLKELEAEMLNALDEKRQIEKELKFERENVSIYQRQIEGHYDSKGDPGTPFGIPGMGAYGAANIDAARRKVADLEKRLAENEKHILTLWGKRDALEGSQWWNTD